MAKEIKLLGFGFTKINVEKNPEFKGKLDVKTNVKMNEVDKQKVDFLKSEALKINFTFTISYGELGNVELTGDLGLLLDSKTMKETLKQWKKKSLPDDVRRAIINLVFQKATLKALSLEEEIGLPLHMPMPRLQEKQSK